MLELLLVLKLEEKGAPHPGPCELLIVVTWQTHKQSKTRPLSFDSIEQSIT